MTRRTLRGGGAVVCVTAAIILAAIGACSGQGPAGPPGPAGPQGSQGVPGVSPDAAGSQGGTDASAPDSTTGTDASDASLDSHVPDSSVDGALQGPPSCAISGDGRTNCGDAGNESCCTSLLVTGGTFDRTYTNSGGGATGLADPASVSNFRLDKYEVTVGRFREFVNAVLPPDGGAGWMPTAGSGKHTHLNGGSGLANAQSVGTFEQGWSISDNVNVVPTTSNLTAACLDPANATWTTAVGVNEKKPLNCENWWEAVAFCIWDGGFLPSGSEWEYAAAGGNQQRERGRKPKGTAAVKRRSR